MKGKGRAKRRRWHWYFLAVIVIGAVGFWNWQPWQLEWRPKTPPPQVWTDPDSPKLFSPGTRVMVVTGHPDDPEFYVGGTLLKLGRAGAVIRLVCCTDGDKAYYPFENAVANRATRQAEQLRALEAWKGESVRFLGFPDGRLSSTQPVVLAILREIEQFRPDYVITFDPVYPPRLSHQDHRRTGEATLRALHMYSRRTWALLMSTMAPQHVVDISTLWEDKRDLLRIHKSQFHGERLRTVESMVRNRAESDGKRRGYVLGEGLRVLRPGVDKNFP